MPKYLVLFLMFLSSLAYAQTEINLSDFKQSKDVKAKIQQEVLSVSWTSGKDEKAKIVIDFAKDKPLIKSLQLIKSNVIKELVADLDPVFLLTVGKRDLVSQNGWNIFFDKTNKKPYKRFAVEIIKNKATVISDGNRTIVKIGELRAGNFTGNLEITLYNNSPLMNFAAVMSTEMDSTAILYDAGLLNKGKLWKNISWRNPADQLQATSPTRKDTITPLAVKYRTIVGNNEAGSVAVFPAPHQYFYPLDEAFNLNFTWFGQNYANLFADYGLGIRQDLNGDNRYVPWFNAPPKTQQRLNFYCLLSTETAEKAIEEVKKFTNGDRYKPLAHYKTMSSHFHNEYVMNAIIPQKEEKGTPIFVDVFKNAGINIVHLGEFHYTAHPKGPDSLRLKELSALHDMCSRFSDKNFLLLPGEEPNEFYGGHWLSFFPKPVNWIMARSPEKPFVTQDSVYGKVYRIANKAEMLKLLELENGLAWTAHARTKGSTGYPDKYKEEDFYKSDRFMGAAWKNIPADLSTPKIGKRVLDLMDDMANWGLRKHVIAESDIFTIRPENEMYAHLNVNYIEMETLPKYKDGWQPVLDAMQNGKFFVSTGEVLLPEFTVNGKRSGETITLNDKNADAEIIVKGDWTFPLNFLEIITGDGKSVFREKINLNYTSAFGSETFKLKTNLKGKKWIRVELWDIATNGAFSQQIWIE